MSDTPDTQALVAEMRKAGEGRTKGPWTFQAFEPECESDASYHVLDGNGYSLLSDEQYYPIAPDNTRDARFIAYAGTNWGIIADTLEAQSKEIKRLRDALAPLLSFEDRANALLDDYPEAGRLTFVEDVMDMLFIKEWANGDADLGDRPGIHDVIRHFAYEAREALKGTTHD